MIPRRNALIRVWAFSFFFSAFLLAVPLANAYPIFYKCDANKQMTESLTGPELMEKLRPLLSLPKSQQATELAQLCDGLQECQNQLSQILQATQIDKNVAEKLYESELQKLSSSNGSQPIDEASFDYEKQVIATGFGQSACRNTIEDLPASSFENNGSAFIYYPHYDQYTYVTGCRPDPQWTCVPNSTTVLQNTIRKAILGGVDPYFVLAIGLMENGANGAGQLYLDPIGRETAMGCTSQHADSTTPGALNSYGTYYKVNSGVVQNSALSARLSKAIITTVQMASQPSPTDSPSGNPASTSPASSVPTQNAYYCQDTGGRAAGSFQKTPSTDKCCIQVNVPKSSDLADTNNQLKSAADGQFLMEFLRNTQNSQLPGKTDPAYRIQHFNGFSQLMGGAEGVSVFRSGVNYYNTPAYGYQGMDYILNSLVSNPYIRNLVNQVTQQTGSHYPSVLCQDVAVPGTYQIDSDNYFKKHRDSPRMGIIVGKTWSSMSTSEKKVLTSELMDTPVITQLIKQFPSLPDEIANYGGNPNYGTNITFPNGSNIAVSSAFNTASPGNASLQPKTHGTLPEDANLLAFNLQAGFIPIDPQLAKNGLSLSFQNGETESVTFQGGYVPPEQWNHLDPVQTVESSVPPPAQFTEIFGNGAAVINYVKDSTGNYNTTVVKSPTDQESLYALSSSLQEQIQFPDHSGFTVQATCAVATCKSGIPTNGDYKMTYSNGQSIQVQNGNLSQLDKADYQGAAAPPSMDQVVAYYFKNIYPSRNTVGKASPIQWGDLTNDELNVITQSFRGFSNIGAFPSASPSPEPSVY